jgi:hypothetical protein
VSTEGIANSSVFSSIESLAAISPRSSASSAISSVLRG